MVLQSPHPLLGLRPAECVVGSAGTLMAGRYSKASVSLSLVCVSYHQHGTGNKPFRPPYREYRRSLVCARSPERLSVSASLAVRFAQLRPDSRRKPSQRIYSADICNCLLCRHTQTCRAGERKHTACGSRQRSTKSRGSAARPHRTTQWRIVGKMRSRLACGSRSQPCST